MCLMSRKSSIYVDEALDSVLAARDGERASKARRHGRRSLIFREMVRRYDAICRADVPELDDGEWMTLLQAGASWADGDVDGDARMGRLFTAAGPGGRLLKKLGGLTAGERFAVIDTIERYWAAKARGEQPEAPGQNTGEAVAKHRVRAGARG